MTGVQDELFQIGWLAADVLKRFTTLQNSIRSSRVLIFVPVNFSQHEKDAHVIHECFHELADGLAEIIPDILPGSKEDDLAQALGHYLCAVINSVSAYEHLTRLLNFHGKRKRLRGVIRVWRARRAFDREVNEYHKNGVILQRIWAEMEATLN